MIIHTNCCSNEYNACPSSKFSSFEHGFSSANRIKTKLRNWLKVPTIDTLLRISIEGHPIDQFDFSKSLDYYKKTKQHRIFNYN